MKTKPTNIIQRLCLFLFALVLALPAVATNYDREGYEIFRSRKTVEQVGKNKRVYELRQGPVKIWFDDGKTTSGTGSGAIYELKKGSRIQVFVDDGYAIRWIILRDTEGGKRYSDPEGIKRIDRVSSGYSYYFERNAISNSHISGGNQNQLNDDDNNIVVQQYDATDKIIAIYTHNNSKWDQFKVRDIIVGYVRKPKVRYTREQYNIYSTLESFDPYLKRDGHTGDVKWVLDNPDIADISGNGYVRPKRPGMGTLTATFSADRVCAKVQCSTTINVQRDRVNFTAKDLPNMLFDKYDFRSHIKTSTASKKEFRWDNPQLSITSSNSSILSCDNGTLKPGGTAGEATITLRQKQNDLYEAATFSHTFIVMRKDQDGTVLIKDANEWKLFCKLVNDKGMTNLNARLEADIDLEWEIAMVGNDYAGTFDGQNHTLKFIWYVESDSYIAPFKKVKDATIKNLRTEGEIYGKTHYFSGLITEVYGKTAITGCVSNVNITSYYSGDRCAAAGMISYIGSGANVTITDCIVKGKFNAIMDNARKGISGFVYAQNGICTLTNCLYIGKNNATDNSYTFADNATIKNCYFLDACGSKQGEQVTLEQLKNGEVIKLLQADRTDKCYWAQQLGEMPDFYNAADKSKANYVYYDAAKKGWTCDDFRLTDGQPLPIGIDFTAANVTYERKFNGTQNATLCLPYDLYAQGFKAYTLSGGNKNEVHFKEVDDKLTAYTPYYITANGMPQLGGRNIEVKAYKADKMTTPAAGYKFTGTVAGVSNATAAATNAYILQDDGKFHKVTTENPGATVPAYRAYIICPPQASGAKQLSVVLDGETTGIGSTTNEATDGKNGPVYDLQGRRVADRLDDARHRLPAGVYIVGGRKVVVK